MHTDTQIGCTQFTDREPCERSLRITHYVGVIIEKFNETGSKPDVFQESSPYDDESTLVFAYECKANNTVGIRSMHHS